MKAPATNLRMQILMLLTTLQQKGHQEVRAKDLEKMLNQARAKDIAPNNFRNAIKKLAEYGYAEWRIVMHKNVQHMVCKLTQSGADYYSQNSGD